MEKSWCVRGRHHTETLNENVTEKINLKKEKARKICERQL